MSESSASQVTSSDLAPVRATIRDVARLAGVSVATVSRVVNDRPDVSPETREAVMHHVRALSFSTNRSARALSRGKTGLVGFTIPFVLGDYYSWILSGATEALHEQEMRAVLCPTRHEHDREAVLVERLLRGTTDGAILVLPSESDAELRELATQGFPFVVIDPAMPLDERIPVVSATHWAGARSATDHLLELGTPKNRDDRRTEGLGGDRGAGERVSGRTRRRRRPPLARARRRRRLRDRRRLPGSAPAARDRRARRPRSSPPTTTWRSARYEPRPSSASVVPDQLSIVGFDDSELARVVTPALTTVWQPLEEMGRMAVSLLTRLIDGQRVETLRVELATRLVLRDSTAPPPRVGAATPPTTPSRPASRSARPRRP